MFLVINYMIRSLRFVKHTVFLRNVNDMSCKMILAIIQSRNISIIFGSCRQLGKYKLKQIK